MQHDRHHHHPPHSRQRQWNSVAIPFRLPNPPVRVRESGTGASRALSASFCWLSVRSGTPCDCTKGPPGAAPAALYRKPRGGGKAARMVAVQTGLQGPSHPPCSRVDRPRGAWGSSHNLHTERLFRPRAAGRRFIRRPAAVEIQLPTSVGLSYCY